MKCYHHIPNFQRYNGLNSSNNIDFVMNFIKEFMMLTPWRHSLHTINALIFMELTKYILYKLDHDHYKRAYLWNNGIFKWAFNEIIIFPL